MFEFVKPDSRREIQTVQTVQSNEESEDSDSSQDSEDDQEEAPCKMPRLEPFYFSPNTTNPAAVADCTAASGFSTMISDNSTCTVRSDNSVVRSDNSAVRSDSRAVRPNSNAVRNLSESLKSDIQHRTSMENGDLEQPDGTSLESSNTENIAIDDQSCVGERGDIVSGSPDDHFDIRTSSLSARPTETSMDYDDDNELPEL